MRGIGVRSVMSKMPISLPVTRLAAVLVTALVLAACGGATTPPPSVGGSPGPSTSPAPGVSSAPSVDAIAHKTGATDVILRMEQGGGFVPIDFIASQAPMFTLYGDGVIVFQPALTTFPEPDANGIVHSVPWRTAKLDEEQIQALLEFAITAGGLGTARETYVADGIADAPSTIFTIRAGGLDKTVNVNALSELTQPGPDVLARSAFYKLFQRLQDFDRGGSIPSDVYASDRFRGVIFEREADGSLNPVAWPWPDVKPTGFTQPTQDGSGPPFPHRVMSSEEIAALKIDNIAGGLQNLILKGPDGKLYTFILRPLLVDETI
jgi:hypothetical protein